MLARNARSALKQVSTRDIASLFIKKPLGALEQEISNGNRTKMEIMFALRYKGIAENAFNVLAEARNKIKFFENEGPVSLDGIDNFPLRMERKYGITQPVYPLSEEQTKIVDELAANYNGTGIHFIVNFIYGRHADKVEMFQQKDAGHAINSEKFPEKCQTSDHR